ncbi:response regulator transcription factor [Anaerotignum sp. MSJ-24]|uniref:response regulator transcription factor n=1 Tax=Anaerotignum sp. MSJ-24 TaxID=2841521 RepID=UPI001C10CD36|nr:response regulator transcription factor [Anaerotignum sp. MSJ-24]MBU5463383.1 response regulator transcription factor [Anaerotignum sp. MSJ-24]
MKVMIVEDQIMIRSLLESYFRAKDDYRIIASIPGAKQAVEVCRINPVDLILMDVQTENRENGLIAVSQIKAICPKTKIIVVTSLIDGAVLDEAKRAGADSLWYKDSTEKRLMDVVKRTMEGEHIFPDAPPTVNIGMAKSTEFTKTELKVLRHLVRGLSYTRIAAEMGCEMSTVKFHVANMLQKTGLENKLQLALAVSNVKLIADLEDE